MTPTSSWTHPRRLLAQLQSFKRQQETTMRVPSKLSNLLVRPRRVFPSHSFLPRSVTENPTERRAAPLIRLQSSPDRPGHFRGCGASFIKVSESFCSQNCRINDGRALPLTGGPRSNRSTKDPRRGSQVSFLPSEDAGSNPHLITLFSNHPFKLSSFRLRPSLLLLCAVMERFYQDNLK